MKSKMKQQSPRAERCSEDPFALTENCDYPLETKAVNATTPAAADDKHTKDDDDDVAMPIPIATLVFQDGRTAPVYTPIAGHEHLFKAQPMMSSPAPPSKCASDTRRAIQPATTQVPGTPQQGHTEPPQQNKPLRQAPRKQKKLAAQPQSLLKSKSLKRRRSVAQGLSSSKKIDADKDADDKAVEASHVVTEESHTFYIGDIDAFKEFLRCRFDELTMKPLRGIATHWVKLLEPRRLGDWGKYHEMLPSEADTPPWWPATVIYREPSHLKKDDLSTLAVEMMLIHRKIDEVKRKGAWVAKLRDVANFTVQTTSADNFSSSKGTDHSEEMKKRAIEQVLPSIFDVAQAYEDHIVQYNLFEGSGSVDPGRGKHHTWKPIPRPIRRPSAKRPRRSARTSLNPVQETIGEVSEADTEPDETMTRFARVPHGLPALAPSPQTMPPLVQSDFQTPRHSISIEDSHRQSWSVDTPVTISGPCTPVFSHDDAKMHRTASTPNSSFDQSLHGLHLGEEDLDMKPQARTMSEQGNMQPAYNMIPYNQPVPYPAPTGYTNQPYQPTGNYPNPAPSSYAQTGPAFVNPFSMYHAPQPPMGYSQYATPMPATGGYPYEQNMFPPTPVSYPGTPMSMSMAPPDPNMAFHGLPTEYPVDPQGRPGPQGMHHF
ncbi:hypothetical protein OPT61_g9083 [Boeremia exigua]|uniref:Uncharacterized protein n=1 Tax=Boeremia exigua TaxID=749465 RepID=A0ACC2HWF2_9PLEO|nr:hypothetical protein OPT61_g9083 [Boeremia exigua]